MNYELSETQSGVSFEPCKNNREVDIVVDDKHNDHVEVMVKVPKASHRRIVLE